MSTTSRPQLFSPLLLPRRSAALSPPSSQHSLLHISTGLTDGDEHDDDDDDRNDLVPVWDLPAVTTVFSSPLPSVSLPPSSLLPFWLMSIDS